MSEFYPIIAGFIFMIIVSGATILFLRLLVPAWWKYRLVRLGAYNVPVFGGLCILLWGIGTHLNIQLFLGVGAIGSALTVVGQIAMLLSLPISGTYNWFLRHIKKNLHRGDKPDVNRRQVLKAAAAVFPVAAITTGTFGVANSFSNIKIPFHRMKFANLPESLDGLRILQLSDVHLGYYVILEDVETILAKVKKHKPDIVMITGDLADDLTALPYALEMIYNLKPRLGAYACLGNHEYYRGISDVITIFNDSPIPLLVNTGLTIDVDGTKLYVGGADDPKYLSKNSREFFESTVDECLRNSPDDAFRIMMCHRPQGFEPAAERGVDLTLSGHTHGGQIGFGDVSIFEYMMPVKYLWGQYKKANGSQLYTSCGMGHWFPFRLGCPQEAPIIVLERA